MPAEQPFNPGPSREEPARRRGAQPSAEVLSFAARKEQQLAFLLTRQLVEAQFRQADGPRSQRLWQEVAALELDPERITALLYGVCDHDDNSAMEAVDQPWACAEAPHGFWSVWARRPRPRQRPAGAWPRSAPRAGSRAHREDR
ncbi:MAG: hypothetical protein ACKOXO_10840 [Cyanobium sp.]